MLPLLQREVVENKHWATQEELMDYFAVGQCTPGVIAVNTATFIGFNKKGVLGGIVATIGVVLPSVCIIVLIASLLQNFSSLPVVQHALGGVRIAVCVLVLNAVIKLFRSGVKDHFGSIVFVIALICAYFSLVPTIGIIILAAIAGVIAKYIKNEVKQ